MEERKNKQRGKEQVLAFPPSHIITTDCGKSVVKHYVFNNAWVNVSSFLAAPCFLNMNNSKRNC